MKRPNFVGYHFFTPDFIRPTAVCVSCGGGQESERHLVARQLSQEALCPQR